MSYSLQLTKTPTKFTAEEISQNLGTLEVNTKFTHKILDPKSIQVNYKEHDVVGIDLYDDYIGVETSSLLSPFAQYIAQELAKLLDAVIFDPQESRERVSQEDVISLNDVDSAYKEIFASSETIIRFKSTIEDVKVKELHSYLNSLLNQYFSTLTKTTDHLSDQMLEIRLSSTTDKKAFNIFSFANPEDPRDMSLILFDSTLENTVVEMLNELSKKFNFKFERTETKE